MAILTFMTSPEGERTEYTTPESDLGPALQEALLDRLEELEDIEDLQHIRREPTRPLAELLAELKLNGTL